MIECYTEISTVIDNVIEVTVGQLLPGTSMKHRRFITVRTSHGETVQLILQAEDRQKLEVKDDPQPWLIPKIYKDKFMHEQEPEDER